MRRRIKTACVPDIKDGRLVYYCGEGYSFYGKPGSRCVFSVETNNYNGCRYYGGEYGMIDSRDWRNYRCFNPKAQKAALPRFVQRMSELFIREKSKLKLSGDENFSDRAGDVLFCQIDIRNYLKEKMIEFDIVDHPDYKYQRHHCRRFILPHVSSDMWKSVIQPSIADMIAQYTCELRVLSRSKRVSFYFE